MCFSVGFVQRLLLAKMEKTTKNPNIVPMNTIIGRGWHLRGFLVNEKIGRTVVHS